MSHCSAKKDDTLKNTGRKVKPIQLYTAKPLVRFMKKCDKMKVNWAILSDKYGIWFPSELHEWYNKHPNSVTEEELLWLKRDLDEKLADFSEILFYHNPGRFHPFYKELLNSSKFRNRIKYFSHLCEIH